MLKRIGRQFHADERFEDIKDSEDYSEAVFTRCAAKGIRFSRVVFKKAILDGCYMRNCTFESCDFTGCRFIASNFHGSTFHGCRFDYASFDRTEIGMEVMDSNCPPFENLTLRFARALRVNYQQLGDSDAVNKAILIELRATDIHYRKAWQSNEAYYRDRYAGLKRVEMLFRWVWFKIGDFIWGCGESPLKLARTMLIAVALIALSSTFLWPVGLWHAVISAFQVLLGTMTPTGLPGWYLPSIVAARIILFALLTSVLVRRLSHR